MLPQRAMHRPQKAGIAAAVVALMVCSLGFGGACSRRRAMQRHQINIRLEEDGSLRVHLSHGFRLISTDVSFVS
jgi:hypothetical protein